MVDCGVLVRSDPVNYTYQFTDHGREFIEKLSQSPSVDAFISNGFALSARALFDQSAKPGDHDISSWIARAYKLIATGLGYVAVREAAVVSVAISLSSACETFEIEDAEIAILEMARKYGRQLRLTKSRTGETLFRMDRSLAHTTPADDPL
jgi:hypothetical protein